MLVPVKLWDAALELELGLAAIRRVCHERGVQASPGSVAACNQRFFSAISRGYKGSRLLFSALLTSYAVGPPLVNGLLAAGLSYLTRRIVDEHLQENDTLDTLTENRIRQRLAALVMPRTG